MSDFPKSAARISEGFCALCDDRLDANSYCAGCEVGWALRGGNPGSADDVEVFGTAGVLVVPSRKLMKDEIKRLYARTPTTKDYR